jgi:hypothetical protein
MGATERQPDEHFPGEVFMTLLSDMPSASGQLPISSGRRPVLHSGNVAK